MKFNNHRGNGFDSKAEERRYDELLKLEEAGVISDLRRQVKFTLIPPQRAPSGKAVRSVVYIADFVYKKDGEKIVEDKKGFKTKDYIIKKKLMLYIHGIEVLET